MAVDLTWVPSALTLAGAVWGSWLLWRGSKRTGDQTAEGTFRGQLWTANQAQAAEIKDLKAHIVTIEAKQLETDRRFRILQKRYDRVETQLQYAVVWGQTVGRAENDPRPIPSWLTGLPNGTAGDRIDTEEDDSGAG